MKFKKDIVFFDIETTGLDIQKDRICQICLVKLNQNGEEIGTINHYVNPEKELHPIAAKKTNLDIEFLKKFQPFKTIASEVYDFIEGCDIGGFNSETFDILFLQNEFSRCGIEWHLDSFNSIDVMILETALTSRTLADTYERYYGQKFNAHDAKNDILATIDVFKKQIEKLDVFKQEDISSNEIYDNFLEIKNKKRFDFSRKIIFNDDGFPVWNFGKNKGDFILNDVGYLKWVLNSDFPEETKKRIKEYLKKIKEERNSEKEMS